MKLCPYPLIRTLFIFIVVALITNNIYRRVISWVPKVTNTIHTIYPNFQFNQFKTMSTVPLDHPYHQELLVATLAVQRASNLTKKLSDSIATTQKSGTQTKDDKSPVTIGDYASQAIINEAIKRNFPTDEIVGEEDSESLKESSEEAKRLSSKILEIIQEEQADKSNAGVLGELNDLNSVYDAIDLGNSKGGSKGRFWALDPIDGTKGFLRGDQFAVCLALIEDGKVVLGVIGCPNLAETIVTNNEQTGVKGGLFSAVKGVGSFYTPLFGSKSGFTPLKDQERIQMKQTTTPDQLKVVEGVEKGHSSHSTQSQIKDKLGFNTETVVKQTINLDSQVKYCVLAKGQADIYLRLPINDKYREKIWDHAAGNILVYESGGQVGDIYGHELNFGNGRLLDSKGVIAGNKAIFPSIVKSVKEVLEL